MNDLDLLRRLAVALAIGLLIGLERGWRQREEAEGERTAGLRTYTLTALLGGVSAALSNGTSGVFLGFAFMAFAFGFTAFAWLEARAERNFSVTGVVAGMLAFALGAYAVLGHLQIAIAGGVIVTVILALKRPLHSWLRTLTWVEIRAALILLTMTFLALPLLPDRPVDPWGAINPAEIWLLAIIIAGISFIGYIALRVAGTRAGIAVLALAGGLASSTATTLTLARLARDQPKASPVLAAGILLSGSVMVARVLIVASALNVALLAPLLAPLGSGLLVLLVSAGLIFVRYRGGDAASATLTLTTPFDLGTALKLASLIAVISLLAKWVVANVGETALTVLAALSGIADVDAITLSMARLSRDGITVTTAVEGIAVAVAVNTLVKAGMTFGLGTRQTGLLVGIASALAIGAGTAAFLLGL
ncbi:MgtC/SapB family protein [Microvirga antarctica]|uniref:MgtC/SapB family protein n=1 Tax=Microvirga antarctica TaxID=2819233 RepID=UPI001B31849F|nr:MgtC/SapB family protein [Microvirga antarctica]